MKMLVLFTMISVFTVISCTDNKDIKENMNMSMKNEAQQMMKKNMDVKKNMDMSMINEPNKMTTVDLVHLTDGGKGVAGKAGEVTITPADKGTSFYVKASGITPGEHGFHVHEFPYLTMPESGADWDPAGTKSHKGPYSTAGHKGDLPFLTADANGIIDEIVTAPNITFEEVMNKSIMIHDGGDNYTDTPPNGGGGGRMMATVVE